MVGIFEELKELGLQNLDKVEIFASQEVETKKDGSKQVNKLTVEEIVYDKSYSCPVCGDNFKSKTIKSGKNRLMTVELDLKPIYDIVNPLYYEPVICEKCGYAALMKNFNSISSIQARWVREQITTQYKPYQYPKIMTAEEAIRKYKLVLLNAVVKKAKDGEKAYVCLKIAWVYRDLKLEKEEHNFLKYALTGFLNAYNKEGFPIFELDELTVAYIIADIYRRFKDYSKALQWVGYVVLDRSVSLRLKTKALHLKSVIREEKEAVSK